MENIKKTSTLEEASLLSPQELKVRTDRGEIIVGNDFTEEDKKKIANLAKRIDITDRAGIISYGAESQNKIASFSNGRLSEYDTSKLGKSGEALADLMVILKGYDPDLENKKGLAGYFLRKKQKIEDSLNAARASFASVSTNINEAEKILLKEHYEPLTREAAQFAEMYKLVLACYHELTMYIAAGQERLDYAKSVELVELDRKAQETKSPIDIQKLTAFSEDINSFEGGLYCLESSRQLIIFQAATIRQLQSSYLDTAKQIQQFISVAIPMWRTQMRIQLDIQEGNRAQASLQAARDFTDQLFTTSASELKKFTLDTAANANKPILSIEASIKVNDEYVSMLDEKIAIQKKNMEEVREGRRIIRQIEEKTQESMRNYAIESSRIAVDQAYINENPYMDSFDGGIHDATGDEPKKYTL